MKDLEKNQDKTKLKQNSTVFETSQQQEKGTFSERIMEI